MPKISGGHKLRRMYDSFLSTPYGTQPHRVDTSNTPYSHMVLAKLLNNVEGQPLTIQGPTAQSFDGINYTDARLYFPYRDTNGNGRIKWEEKTTEDTTVQVWNNTFYDLYVDEPVWVYEQGSEWIIDRPYFPEIMYFFLTQDLFPDSFALADTAIGPINILAAPGFIPPFQFIGAQTYGFAERGKIWFYATSFNSCPIIEEF